LTLATLPLAGCGMTADRTASADQGAQSALAEAMAPAPPSRLPAGTNLHVRLLQSLSSATARSGDHFDAELAEPVQLEGAPALPRGARIRGRVASARASGGLRGTGYLRVTLDSIQTPDGSWHDVETTAVSLRGGSHKRRNAVLIGGGSGLGALIGGAAGGGAGAAIGALSGAGAGTVGALVTGKKDVGFAAERILVFATKREEALRR